MPKQPNLTVVERLQIAERTESPEEFLATLSDIIKSGLDKDSSEWLATFLRNNGAANIKITFSRVKRGNPTQQMKKTNWKALRAYQELMNAVPKQSKEEVFAIAKDELVTRFGNS